jgi:hypothetical protein
MFPFIRLMIFLRYRKSIPRPNTRYTPMTSFETLYEYNVTASLPNFENLNYLP